MVKTIAFCSDKNQAQKNLIARSFAAHLQTYFGSTKLVDHAAKSYFSNVLCTANTAAQGPFAHLKRLSERELYLEKVFYNQDAFCADLRRSELRISRGAERTGTALGLTAHANGSDGYAADFTVLDAGFGSTGFDMANEAKLDELVVVLEDTVSRYSEAYQFIKNGLNQIDGRRFNIVVNHGFCGNQAADIYDRLDDMLNGVDGLSYRFVGFVPSFKNDPKFRTLETMSLQSIAHELLNLTYDDKVNTIPRAMFEGALN